MSRLPVKRVRFKKEPYGLRGSAVTNVLEPDQRNGWTIVFDDVTLAVYLTSKGGDVHVLHLSDFEDVFLQPAPPPPKK